MGEGEGEGRHTVVSDEVDAFALGRPRAWSLECDMHGSVGSLAEFCLAAGKCRAVPV